VPKADTAAQRLQRLERILALAPTAISPSVESDSDGVQMSLRTLPLERIRQLTSEVSARSQAEIDAVDAVAIRVLLNDYRAAVSSLRAVARTAARRVAAASEPINRTRRFLLRARDREKQPSRRS
jgi:hypothetical protein